MFTTEEINILNQAEEILRSKINTQSVIESPELPKSLLQKRLAHLDHEVFCVIYLSTSMQLIDIIDHFKGSISASAVYPREIVKQALTLRASFVIVSHNHPSGNLNPSQADKNITKRLSEALKIAADIDLLDHIIVSVNGTYSFAEKGLL